MYKDIVDSLKIKFYRVKTYNQNFANMVYITKKWITRILASNSDRSIFALEYLRIAKLDKSFTIDF